MALCAFIVLPRSCADDFTAELARETVKPESGADPTLQHDNDQLVIVYFFKQTTDLFSIVHDQIVVRLPRTGEEYVVLGKRAPDESRHKSHISSSEAAPTLIGIDRVAPPPPSSS